MLLVSEVGLPKKVVPSHLMEDENSAFNDYSLNLQRDSQYDQSQSSAPGDINTQTKNLTSSLLRGSTAQSRDPRLSDVDIKRKVQLPVDEITFPGLKDTVLPEGWEDGTSQAILHQV